MSSYIPIDRFFFGGDGAKGQVDISGGVTLKFAGSTRKLSINMDRMLQSLFEENQEESAEFSLILKIEPENEALGLEDGDAMMNSATATAGKLIAIFGVAVASAFALL